MELSSCLKLIYSNPFILSTWAEHFRIVDIKINTWSFTVNLQINIIFNDIQESV